jgi:phosphoribosylaminoimidazole carboxylase (NCAIR synthetase)
MFVLNNSDILINELAPRPHNSGHPTIESYNQSQYDILIKAILDEPFGKLELRKSTTMHNLL